MRTLVCNGWAAGPEIWEFCAFPRDRIFSYLEELDGLPDRVLADGGPAVLVGFSMGGNYALKLLVEQPSQVCGLVLVSATPRMTEDKATGWRGMSPRRIEALRLGTRLVNRGNPSPLYDWANMDRGIDFLNESDRREDLKSLMRDGGKGGFERMPVRVLQAERDGIVCPENAAWFAETFPQAKVTLVPGGEHLVPVTAPELVDAAVREVLGAFRQERNKEHEKQEKR